MKINKYLNKSTTTIFSAPLNRRTVDEFLILFSCQETCKVSGVIRSPLTSPVSFELCSPSSFLSPLVLFLWHGGGQCYDVLRLLQRGHVNHAATEGERTLDRFTTQERAERATLE